MEMSVENALSAVTSASRAAIIVARLRGPPFFFLEEDMADATKAPFNGLASARIELSIAEKIIVAKAVEHAGVHNAWC